MEQMLILVLSFFCPQGQFLEKNCESIVKVPFRTLDSLKCPWSRVWIEIRSKQWSRCVVILLKMICASFECLRLKRSWRRPLIRRCSGYAGEQIHGHDISWRRYAGLQRVRGLIEHRFFLFCWIQSWSSFDSNRSSKFSVTFLTLIKKSVKHGERNEKNKVQRTTERAEIREFYTVWSRARDPIVSHTENYEWYRRSDVENKVVSYQSIRTRSEGPHRNLHVTQDDQ